MHKLTPEDFLALTNQKNISVYDVDTEKDFNDSAEMYSVSINKNKNKNKKLNKNTFQQSTDPTGPTNENVRGQAPRTSSPPSAPSVREYQGIPKDQDDKIATQKYGRRINLQNDKIIEMHLQFSHIKQGSRYCRIKAYISIKTESDSRYMIFMRSALTTAVDETFRSIRNDCDKVLESEASKIYSDYYNQGLCMGRVKYKPVKGNTIKDYHRKNLPLSLLSAWISDGHWHAKFYFLDRDYEFILDEEITDKQKPFYSAQGTWSIETSALSITEAFGD